jgi:hypothetical protein
MAALIGVAVLALGVIGLLGWGAPLRDRPAPGAHPIWVMTGVGDFWMLAIRVITARRSVCLWRR